MRFKGVRFQIVKDVNEYWFQIYAFQTQLAPQEALLTEVVFTRVRYTAYGHLVGGRLETEQTDQ